MCPCIHMRHDLQTDNSDLTGLFANRACIEACPSVCRVHDLYQRSCEAQWKTRKCLRLAIAIVIVRRATIHRGYGTRRLPDGDAKEWQGQVTE